MPKLGIAHAFVVFDLSTSTPALTFDLESGKSQALQRLIFSSELHPRSMSRSARRWLSAPEFCGSFRGDERVDLLKLESLPREALNSALDALLAHSAQGPLYERYDLLGQNCLHQILRPLDLAWENLGLYRLKKQAHSRFNPAALEKILKKRGIKFSVQNSQFCLVR